MARTTSLRRSSPPEVSASTCSGCHPRAPGAVSERDGEGSLAGLTPPQPFPPGVPLPNPARSILALRKSAGRQALLPPGRRSTTGHPPIVATIVVSGTGCRGAAAALGRGLGNTACVHSVVCSRARAPCSRHACVVRARGRRGVGWAHGSAHLRVTSCTIPDY